jgi:hypothetical protein
MRFCEPQSLSTMDEAAVPRRIPDSISLLLDVVATGWAATDYCAEASLTQIRVHAHSQSAPARFST